MAKQNSNSPPACPVCNKQAQDAFTPFCSKRCADVDLHRWLSGRYAIPSSDDESEDTGETPGAGQ